MDAFPAIVRSRRCLASLMLLLAFAPAAPAHPVPRRAHDRTIEVVLAGDAVVVKYRLEVDQLTVLLDDLPAVEDQVDLKKLGKPDEFYEAYTRCYAPILAERLEARLDGRPLRFTCVQRGHRLVDEAGKPLDHLRCDFVFKARWQPAGGRHDLTFREEAFLEEPGQVLLSLSSQGPLELLSKTEPDRALQERQARDLKPGDEEKRRRAAAEFRMPATATVASPKVVEPVVEERAATETSRHRLLHLLLDTSRGFWALLALAAGFGAVHALTPGHGKTLVAAYLVGERGTAWHACLLGLVTTLTHTGAVLVLAVALRFYFPRTVPADVQAALGLVGGLLIAGMGFWLLLRRLAGRADHFHVGNHGHHHHDDHHGHHHHDHSHGDHRHDGHTHPEQADRSRVGAWGLIVLGIQGGIVPCWDAIAMLLFAISAQRLWLALPLLLAFSAGLAGVLITIGVAIVTVKGVSDARWGRSRLFRALPLVSAALVAALGLWLCYDSVHPDA